MELTMTNNFTNLSQNEIMEIDGGVNVIKGIAGGILIAWSPIIGVSAGIVGTPVGGVVAGAGTFGLGLTLLGQATH